MFVQRFGSCWGSSIERQEAVRGSRFQDGGRRKERGGWRAYLNDTGTLEQSKVELLEMSGL